MHPKRVINLNAAAGTHGEDAPAGGGGDCDWLRALPAMGLRQTAGDLLHRIAQLVRLNDRIDHRAPVMKMGCQRMPRKN